MNIEDQSALLQYLRASGRIKPDEQPAFETLTGGVSNRAVRVKRGDGREDWVLKQALGKLRVEVDWFSSPERIHREATGLCWLGRIIPERVPALIFIDPAHHILAMSAVPQPHENWKRLLLKGRTSIDHARSFGGLLARIHSASAQFPELEETFRERKFFEELRLEPYYGYTASQVPGARAFLLRLVDDARLRRHALVHGDYSPKNVLIHNDELVLLDFEVIHFGDPAFDIGFSLTHFLSKAHYLQPRRAAFLGMARAYWQAYLDDMSAPMRKIVKPFAVQHTLACCLARVAGRSPLEYLTASQRARQRQIVLELLESDINGIPHLIDRFGERLAEGDG